MNEITPGLTGERRILVTPDIAIDFLGLDTARVLSTPHMIMYMEITSRDTVKGALGAGYDTVGTIVNIRHLAAAPLGSSVRFISTVERVDGNRVTFHVEAWDDVEKIGEGSHERAIVNVSKFAARLAGKINRPA
ncbi:MAG: thioesterase family protein [Bryobacterales bacterium]|nr:thioesterase family protein [Bryobacterales bacterium]